MNTLKPDHLSAVNRIITNDNYRMRCLTALRELNLPQGYLAAGFLRNAIWDHIHGYQRATQLNDIDVIYFNPADTSKQADTKIEKALLAMVPCARWEVKNQARMHTHHSHPPYKSCEEAISYWIEKETCVAIRVSRQQPPHTHETQPSLEVLAPFGLESNFSKTISINPRFPSADVFAQRIDAKGWLTTWPELRKDSALTGSG